MPLARFEPFVDGPPITQPKVFRWIRQARFGGASGRVDLRKEIGVGTPFVGKVRDEIWQDRRLDKQRLELGKKILENHAHTPVNNESPEEVSCSSEPRNSSGHIVFPLGKCSLSNGPSTLSDL